MNTHLLAIAPIAPIALALAFALPTSSSSAATPEPPAPTPAAATEAFDIDPGHSGVIFRVKHFGASYFYGRFNQVTGSYELDGSDMTKSKVSVEIDARSIDTNGEDRDKHLKSADFFAVEEFPAITFAGERVTAAPGENEYKLAGKLTLHGVTKPVEADLTFIGRGDDPWGGHRTGFEAKFTIQRSDFGMSYYVDNGALGDDIDVTVFIEGVRKTE